MKSTLLVALLVMMMFGCNDWQIVDYEIPSGYVGRVTINYGDPNCPAERSGVNSIIRVNASGVACSHRGEAPKGSVSHFYYVDAGGRRVKELHRTGWGEGGDIWAEVGSGTGRTHEFFVGSERDYQAAIHRPYVPQPAQR